MLIIRIQMQRLKFVQKFCKRQGFPLASKLQSLGFKIQLCFILKTTGLCPWVPLRQSGFESGREEKLEQKTNTGKSRIGESTVAILHVAVRLTLCVPQDSGTARATLRLRDGDLSAVVWLCVCMRANYVFFFQGTELDCVVRHPFYCVCARSRSSRKVLIARILRAETVFFCAFRKKNCRRAFYCIPSTMMLRVYLRWRDYATKEFCHGFSVI